MSSANRDTLTISLPMWLPFMLLSLLVWLGIPGQHRIRLGVVCILV
jgi:hypothetical protein